MSRTLPIHWQRLVSPEGQTCPRCASTGDEVKRAVKILEQALPPLGIQPELQITQIDTSTFRANPAESNRITIADRTVEDWLGGRTGGSRCCSVCGDSNCRTVEVAGGSPHESPRPQHSTRRLCRHFWRSVPPRPTDSQRGESVRHREHRVLGQVGECRKPAAPQDLEHALPCQVRQ
jgi:hypothetical protein